MPDHRGFVSSYPNVAPEPAMYCPSVRIMPCEPAPYRKMLTVPVCWLACHVAAQNWGPRTKNKTDNYTNSCSVGSVYMHPRGIVCRLLLPPIIAPILTTIFELAGQQMPGCFERGRTLVEIRRAMLATTRDCSNRRHFFEVLKWSRNSCRARVVATGLSNFWR